MVGCVAELRKLSEHCRIGETLRDMMRDRLVRGISDGRRQHHLLAEADLTLKTAFTLAQRWNPLNAMLWIYKPLCQNKYVPLELKPCRRIPGKSQQRHVTVVEGSNQ